jgi:hypothetical protein
MIPGINLLNIALGAIQPQQITWFKFLGNNENELGQDIPSFDAGTPILGSFQPVDARTVQQLGLDIQKSYHNLATSNPVESLKRDNSPDYIVFMGRKHQVAGETNWMAQDGWKWLMFVDVGPA